MQFALVLVLVVVSSALVLLYQYWTGALASSDAGEAQPYVAPPAEPLTRPDAGRSAA